MVRSLEPERTERPVSPVPTYTTVVSVGRRKLPGYLPCNTSPPLHHSIYLSIYRSVEPGATCPYTFSVGSPAYRDIYIFIYTIVHSTHKINVRIFVNLQK